ncbi:molecular chaperone DnaJ [Candidatus Woesearchaeota archaeon]|nr:molecular chaperone DnaJ [Candidatus Woesearchaeota archaeon]
MTKDYYDILSVKKDATREDIKKAYKKKAKKYHPDLNEGDAEAADKFKEVNEAAATLGDDQKRKQYDTVGHAAFSQGTRGGGGFNSQDFSGFGANADFGDIFENFFSGAFGDIFGGGHGRRQRRGSDLRYDLSITLNDAAFGTNRKIRVRKHSLCETCNGSGGSKVETCGTCHGHGMVRQAKRTPFGIFQTTTACPACQGLGKRILEPCKKCDGEGRTLADKELDVQIPPGVQAGSRLRLNEEGEAGGPGATPGDLYVFLDVEAHELFTRHGDDILLEVPISFFQASFGATIEVPTLEGKAKLKIPSGTQSGTIFRLKAQGTQRLHGHGRGDELITVQMETPKKLTKKQEKLLKELSKEFGEGAEPHKSLFARLKKHMHK